jgi:hypothetical protein
MQFVGKIARQLETRSVRLTVSMSQLPMEVFFTQWSVTVSCTFGTKLRVEKKRLTVEPQGCSFQEPTGPGSVGLSPVSTSISIAGSTLTTEASVTGGQTTARQSSEADAHAGHGHLFEKLSCACLIGFCVGLGGLVML